MATQSNQDDSDSDSRVEGLSRRWNRASAWAGNRWGRFNDWRVRRPFVGGVLLCLAGLIITWVPMQILPDLIFIGGEVAGLLAVGAMFGVFVFVSGALALYKPQYSDTIGVVGVVLSILSLFGSLGGLFLGMLLGILGGNLCIAWQPRDEVEDEFDAEPSRVDKAVARVRGGVRRVVAKSIARVRAVREGRTEGNG